MPVEQDGVFFDLSLNFNEQEGSQALVLNYLAFQSSEGKSLGPILQMVCCFL